jgi:hypothetical protein
MDRVPGDLQIGGDARHAPALAVQREHRVPPRGRISDLVVGREAPHRVMARTPPELDTADRGDLVEMEAGVFRLEDEDGLLDLFGQRPMALDFRRAEEARSAPLAGRACAAVRRSGERVRRASERRGRRDG